MKLKLGPDHALTLTDMRSLAVAHKEVGDFANAEKIYRELLATNVRLAGAESPTTAFFESLLGEILIAQDKYDEAESLLLHAYKILLATGTPGGVINRKEAISETAGFLVRLYENTGQPAKAAEWAKKVKQ